ncbi:hypothetical protein HA075_26490 [bacterium BFN5]|nr:hypothetical protein HA075_26490 [bacterium BFN5]
MAWLRVSVFFIAIVYLWIYPSMLLVPEDYRDSFWSLEYNIPQKGIVLYFDESQRIVIYTGLPALVLLYLYYILFHKKPATQLPDSSHLKS